jgi:hypothetical protein
MTTATKINKLAGLIAVRGLKKMAIQKYLKLSHSAFIRKLYNQDQFTKKEIDLLLNFFGVTYEELF